MADNDTQQKSLTSGRLRNPAILFQGAEESREAGEQPVISVHNLTKVYRIGQNRVRALQGISLEVQRGEFVAIMGPSGSGKSTFMNLLGCLDRPSSGDYWLAGVPVSRMSANRLADVRNQFIGFVFQGFNLLARSTALRNVSLPLMYAGKRTREQEHKGRRMLRLLGLKSRINHKPMELSGGQQQRVAIARALVNDPSILLADEPTGNLDSQTSAEIMATFQALNDLGLTILLVTHDPEVAAYARRQIVFRDGRLVSDQPVARRRIVAESGSETGPASPELLQPREQKASAAASEVGVRRKRRTRGSLTVSNMGNAVSALWANRLRSLLTMLGIIIGVGAVIGAVTLTQGTSALLDQNLASLGTNVLSITSTGANSSLTVADANAVGQIAHVQHISPILMINGQVVYSDQHTNAQVEGVNASYQSIGNWNMAQGAWFGNDDDQAGQAVAVIGKNVADTLFAGSGTDPLEQKLLIADQIFRIVGVLQSKGAQAGTNLDNVIFVAFTFASTHLKSTSTVDQIAVEVDSADNITRVQNSITTLLQQRHHSASGGTSSGSSSVGVGGAGAGGSGGGGSSGPGGVPSGSLIGAGNSANDFMILNANQLLQTLEQQGQAQATLLIGIAAISLTVGGIGVMNIMLVSVTERTREIGIRMAIGAQRRHIRNQFLTEALTLSALGGIVGILCGLLGGFILVRTSSQGLPFVLSPLYMLLAFGVSAAVGVIFGLYPAIRAAQLDPIVALRTE